MITNTVSAQFLILIQSPVSNRLIVSDIIRKTGIVGSILLDLLHENSIRIEGDKLITSATETSLSYSHLQVLERLNNSSKTRNINNWISILSRRGATYQKQIFEDLQQECIIQIFNKKFLFIPYYTTHLYNTALREDIIKELRYFVFTGTPLQKSNLMLPGIIQACKLHKIICDDRKERKMCRTRLSINPYKDPVSKHVNISIRQMQLAISAAITHYVINS